MFEVEIQIRGSRYGLGKGRSKKEAEQMAAKQALERLAGT
jgi:ribonuclease-3